MFGLFRKAPPVRILRLVSLAAADRGQIDRPVLKDAVLEGFLHALGGQPDEYDIDGPYRIPKGRTIGLQAFEHKLKEKGHDTCFGYRGETRGECGFQVSFFDAPPYPTGFCEIVVWRHNGSGAMDSHSFVQHVARAIPIDYGYQAELPGNVSPPSEAPVKSSLFGMSTTVGGELAEWRRSVGRVLEGEVRAIYPLNFLNRRQLECLGARGVQASEISNGLYEVRPQ